MIPVHWRHDAEVPTIITPTHIIELNLTGNRIEVKSRFDNEKHIIEFQGNKVVAKSRQSGSKSFQSMTLPFERELKNAVVESILGADRIHTNPREHSLLLREIHGKWNPK